MERMEIIRLANQRRKELESYQESLSETYKQSLEEDMRDIGIAVFQQDRRMEPSEMS